CWLFSFFLSSRKDKPIMAIASPIAQTETQVLGTTLKLICKQSDLARGLSLVSHACLSNSTQPILSYLLLSTDQGRLRISATNLEIGIQVWVDAQIEGEGTTALPGEILTKMIALMPRETMTLSIAPGSQTLHIECAGSVSNIRGQDPREFPIIPGIDGK